MENKMNFNFSAIDRYVEDNIIENNQKEIKGQKLIQYGDKNIYPNYLYDLYVNVSIIKSLVDSASNCFSNITINKTEFQKQINENGDTIEDVVRQIIKDYLIYGGYALNIVRNRIGGIAGIYNLDFKCVRSDKKNTEFYYSEKWADKSLGRVKMLTYPKFNPDDKKQASSILYVKNEKYNTYPSPKWSGAVKSAEILKHIAEFHLNSLFNGLTSDYIVNMNAGVPSDEIKEEVEEMFNERFTGYQNGGRTMISWNPDFQHRATVEAIPQNSFIDRYNALEKSSKEDIYTSFGINPAILGLPTETTGFSDQDIKESWKLANAMVFQPLLKVIKSTFEKIFGELNVITIEVLAIDWTNTGEEDIIE